MMDSDIIIPFFINPVNRQPVKHYHPLPNPPLLVPLLHSWQLIPGAQPPSYQSFLAVTSGPMQTTSITRAYRNACQCLWLMAEHFDTPLGPDIVSMIAWLCVDIYVREIHFNVMLHIPYIVRVDLPYEAWYLDGTHLRRLGWDDCEGQILQTLADRGIWHAEWGPATDQLFTWLRGGYVRRIVVGGTNWVAYDSMDLVGGLQVAEIDDTDSVLEYLFDYLIFLFPSCVLLRDRLQHYMLHLLQ